MRDSRADVVAVLLALGAALPLSAGCRTAGPAAHTDSAEPAAGPGAGAAFVTRDGVPVPLPTLKAGVSRVSACTGAPLALNQECANGDEAQRFLDTTAVAFAFHQAQNPTPPGALSRRDFHPKQHACVAARFEVLAGLPAGVAKGLFASPGVYPAVLRFSNGSPQLVRPGAPIVMKPDAAPDSRGLALKVTGVAGEPLLDGEQPAHPGQTSQDFLMINFPTFFLRNADNYAAILTALATDPNFLSRLDVLERANLIHAQKVIDDVFAERYWSETPVRLGEDRAMKFSVQPCAAGTEAAVLASADRTDPDYLRKRAAARLAAGDVCMTFAVQPQVDPAAMPIEDAAVDWPEARSAFVPVAKLTVVAGQNINDPQRDGFCQDASFNPWNGTVAHAPMGSINRARLLVYAGISRKRRLENAKTAHAEPAADDAFFAPLQPRP